MSLTDLAIRKIKPDVKSRKYAEGEGLFLYVSTSGTKIWRFRYRNPAGIERELSLGKYPLVSLADARSKRDEAKKLLIEGKDPCSEKKETKRLQKYTAQNTFHSIAKEWYDLNSHKWTKKYSIKVWNRLDRYVFPAIGHKSISEITGLEILDEIIRKIEKNGNTETSHKTLQNCAAIFRLAVLTRRIPFSPINDLRGVLKPHKSKSLPAIGINELPLFLKKLENSKTDVLHKMAIKMLLLTFVRQGELRKAKWEHFDFTRKLWVIPAELMKMREEHIVPLSDQAIKVLCDIKQISGDNDYLFPSKNVIKYSYMNENVINDIIHSIGYKKKMVGHGFRALASTTLNELGYSPDVIEKQLAHSERNKVRAAYNRAQYLPQRIKMMQEWGDFIDKIIII